MNIFVGNLSYSATEEMLRQHFGEHGEVTSARIIQSAETGRSRGFGFVEMTNDKEAQAAIEALDGKELDGRALRVNEARARDDRGGGGRGRGGGGGGGGRRDRW